MKKTEELDDLVDLELVEEAEHLEDTSETKTTQETEENVIEVPKGKKKRGTLIANLLILAILPILLLGVIIVIVNAINLTNTVRTQVKNVLKCTAVAMSGSYSLYPGDYTIDVSGRVYKGDLVITGNYDVIDNVKDNTNLEATFYFGNTRIITTIRNELKKRVIGTSADEKVVEAVINKGEEYFETDIEINKKPYYGYYYPVKNKDGKVAGMFFVGMPSEEEQQIRNKSMVSTIVIVSLIVLLSLIFTIINAKKIVKAVSKVTNMLGDVSEGNLDIPMDGQIEKISKRNDEIGEMALSMISLKSSLQTIVSRINGHVEVLIDAAENVNTMSDTTNIASSEISRSVEEISDGTVTQAEETQNASDSIASMGSQIEVIVLDVESLSKNAKHMDESSQDANKIIAELNTSNDKTKDAIKRIAQQTITTNNAAQQIKQAVEYISSVAEETNLLSLNASIEAARAGEQGRGFAVVANQIQKLAEQSNDSALKIGRSINELLADSAKTVEIMSEVNTLVEDQQQKLDATKNQFAQVNIGIDSSIARIEEIAEKTEKLDQDRKEIIEVISNLSAIAEENAAAAEQTTASTEQIANSSSELAKAAGKLNGISQEINEAVSFFKV